MESGFRGGPTRTTRADPDYPGQPGLRFNCRLTGGGNSATNTPLFCGRGDDSMGKGDLRTRRGKIYRGTFGKTRPQNVKKTEAPKAKGKK